MQEYESLITFNKILLKQNSLDRKMLVFVYCSVKVAEHSFWYLVSFTFSSKTLDPLVAKNGSEQVNITNFNFLIIKLTCVPLPWQHD